jgi:hypothetical protein
MTAPTPRLSIAAPGGAVFAGVSLTALAVVMVEILLTRIFSVVTWYHFAFVAVSVAMLGLTAGALIVHLLPRRFAPARTLDHLALWTLLFAAALPVCLTAQIRIPFSTDASAGAVAALAAIYLLACVPFVCAGVTICLALTRFPAHCGRLYAADLAGAALACVLVIGILDLTDAPTAMYVTAAVAAAGAACFGRAAGDVRLTRAAIIGALVLASLSAAHTVLVRRQSPWLRLATVKGVPEAPPLYERWNSFSRIRVRVSPTAHPLGWGLSEAYVPRRPVEQLILDIDGGASTVLTRFDGDPRSVEFLRHDVTSLAHYLRPGGRVLAIGAGGGRDILAGLVFGARSVTGVEINDAIVATVTGRFGEFTGRLDRRPGIAFVNDEARSYLARSAGGYDIIQASLIDTSAATAAGAFSFTENSIYTVEAWDLFLRRLDERGVLSFSWFYFSDLPAEIYRLAALARAALLRHGVADPAAHVLIVRHRAGARSVATILVGRRPFPAGEIAILDRVVASLRFETIHAPGKPGDPAFAGILRGRTPPELAALPLRLDAPTDDTPFFFNMLRVTGVFDPAVPAGGPIGGNLKAVRVLVALLVGVAALTLLTVLVPLGLAARRGGARGALPHLLFFAGIGFGFMLVEIALMQRLTIFLGHPTYGLAVVLFTLLLAGGAGSWRTRAIADARLRAAALRRMVALVVLPGVLAWAAPPLLRLMEPASTPLRIALAVGLLLPSGFLMGMAFPIGLRMADAAVPGLTPWLWAVNGAASVCASVLATVIALGSGISAALWAGGGCYGIGLLAAALAGGGRAES